MSLASLYLVGQYQYWLNQFQFAVKPETKHLSEWTKKGWMDLSFADLSLWNLLHEVSGAQNLQEALFWLALTT